MVKLKNKKSIRFISCLSAFAAISALSISSGLAQESGAESSQKKNLSVSSLAAVEGLKNGAFALAIKYADIFNEIDAEGIHCSNAGAPVFSCSDWRLRPHLEIKTGDSNLFQAINFKAAGELNFRQFRTITGSDGFSLPRSSGIVHQFPFSVGVGTTRSGNFYAVLGEVGYVPINTNWKFSFAGNRYYLGYNPIFGIFFQGGYKFDGNNKSTKGGAVDQSSETTNDEILRIKASFDLTLELPQIPIMALKNDPPPQFITWAKGWYDIAHHDLYHSIGATLRFNIPGQKDKFIDFTVEDGSGEPNFNQGTQFGAGLTFKF